MSIEGSIQVGGARIVPSGLLRAALKLDAVVTTAIGVASAAGSALVADPLGVPVVLLVAIGVFLVAYGGAVWSLSTRAEVPAPAVWAVIVLNVAWAADSLVLLALDGFSPTLAGQVVVAAQAVGVLGFAALQYLGLRRS